MDTPGVLTEAQKHVDVVDFIVDLYDNSFVWASEGVLKTGGYTLEEFTKIRNLDTLDSTVDKEKYRKELSEMLSKRHGISTVLVNSKDGRKIQLTHEYHVFDYNGGVYMAGKGIKTEMVV